MKADGGRTESGHVTWGRGRYRRRCLRDTLGIFLLISGLLGVGCRSERASAPAPRDDAGAAAAAQTPPEAQMEPEPGAEAETDAAMEIRPGQEVSLFDGETLGAWKKTDFGGQGDVYVKDGAIYMEMGSYSTGITWTGPVIRMNYEIMLEAMRVDGTDFFCALTFPVGEKPCTLVLGGWGGTLCGLSNIGFYDASENETTTFYSFKNKVWYHVRLRVEPERIQAWLDGEGLVDVDIEGKRIDIRPEMDLCQPLGIATWVTTGAVRNIFLTKLTDSADE